MTTEHDKAVALAEKHGIQVAKGEHDFGVFPQSLVSMFAEYREELAQRSGVVPPVYEWKVGGMPVFNCDANKVREAIASLEAKLSRATLGWEATKILLEQSEARVRELEEDADQWQHWKPWLERRLGDLSKYRYAAINKDS